MTAIFRVAGIDHVEIFVPDRYAAADWYRRVLGLEIVPDIEYWAEEGGPLMVSSDGGKTMLALFEGEPNGNRTPTGLRRVAFRIDGAGFMAFLDHLEEEPLRDAAAQYVTRERVVDHDRSWSIYFSDPYGNFLEVTTYDYSYVEQHLEEHLSP